uniref:Uncharacterized protein n=1 Tax=Onchocerca volvulus TaxID=6282 RepID=A0A8R1TKM2_ONCVO
MQIAKMLYLNEIFMESISIWMRSVKLQINISITITFTKYCQQYNIINQKLINSSEDMDYFHPEKGYEDMKEEHHCQYKEGFSWY